MDDHPVHTRPYQATRAGNSLIRSFRLNQMSNCERFAQIAQEKWATVSELLRSLRGNEQLWTIRSGPLEKMSDVSKSLISLTKNEWMSDSHTKI